MTESSHAGPASLDPLAFTEEVFREWRPVAATDPSDDYRYVRLSRSIAKQLVR